MTERVPTLPHAPAKSPQLTTRRLPKTSKRKQPSDNQGSGLKLKEQAAKPCMSSYEGALGSQNFIQQQIF